MSPLLERLRRGGRIVAALALFVLGPIGAAAAQETPGDVKQGGLDLIASAPLSSRPVGSGGLGVPSGPFASWTKAQQRSAPPQLLQACSLLWVMSHDAPGTRFLPPALPDADEEELGIDLCLAGHLPVDWPGRRRRLAAARAILERASHLGSTLHLPGSIQP